MGDPFNNMFNIGGGGRMQVVVDPSRVTREEFEAARTFANVIWGTEGLAECLGPSWFLVHDPRWMAMERLWAHERTGMAGGVVSKGISVVTALDLNSQITIIEDPELYSEILGQGRHLLQVVKAEGIDPHDLQSQPSVIRALVEREFPNYQRRDGSWNAETDTLCALLGAGLVGLVADYASLAYSQDWVRMDTNEVVHKDEEIWDHESGMRVPVVAIEVDTIHKALVMRAMVRTTALRLMKQFPGIKWEDFEQVQLTDEESDQLCQLLFDVDYDKIYTVLPKVMNLVNRAKDLPYEQRETAGLTTLQERAAEFIKGLQDGTITPIITPIEESTDGRVDPGKFLGQIQKNPYCAAVFQAAQNLAERGDTEAEALVNRLVQSGGLSSDWVAVEDFLQLVGQHPKQDVLEGRQTFDADTTARLTELLQQAEIVEEGTEEDVVHQLTEEQVAYALEVARFLSEPELAVAVLADYVYRVSAERTPAAMAEDVKDALHRAWIAQRRQDSVTTVEGTNP